MIVFVGGWEGRWDSTFSYSRYDTLLKATWELTVIFFIIITIVIQANIINDNYFIN